MFCNLYYNYIYIYIINLKTIIMKKSNIHNLINLKVLIIDSLKKQGYRDEWIYPFLKSIDIHKIHYSN